MSKAQPRPEATQSTYTPRPRAPARALVELPPAAPVPKFPYVRDERFQLMCRAQACAACGREGPDAGVTWAHSNQGIHGHGRGVKASDEFVAAMCWICHAALDQGGGEQEANVALWTRCYVLTVQRACVEGTWPAGMPLPALPLASP